MTIEADRSPYVSANGIDIHYVEAGAGEPLVLLHQGMVSTNPLWADSPVAYAGHMDAFAERFRVIAPDLRGCGRTANPGGGSISYAQLADDAAALIDALGLDQPLVCGFSDGATLATILALRSPGSVRAIVNHAGYDLFNPQAPSFAMARQVLGGSPDATEADPAAAERFFDVADLLSVAFDLPRGTQAIVAVGGGLAVDAGKYIGFLNRLPVIAVPTASPTTASPRPAPACGWDGRRVSAKAAIPFGVVIDTTVIAGCPPRFTLPASAT